ncbi:MAG: HRDC domain-containing protein [Sedimentisphaerales bacterium]|nr:HRDC domain-containing protein [Sedimentisphaerales bacterium]
MTNGSWKDLYEVLRKLRLQIARDNEMPSWWCSNKLLQEIARRRPSTVENFTSIKDIKPRHIKFAELFINTIKEYCQQNDFEMNLVPKTKRRNTQKLRQHQEQLRATVGSLSGVDMGLYRKLQNLRLRLAHEKSRGRSRIFHNFAIRDMARHRPSTYKNLLKVYGVGQKKCDEYGGLFIDAIKEYCEGKSIEMDVEFAFDIPASDE